VKTDTDLEVLAMMTKFGGSFVKALAECAHRADDTNFDRLKAAFPDIWKRYTELLGLGREDIG
jgi:hypothetical protein